MLDLSWCPLMEGMVVENYTLKVVLPEGAEDISVHNAAGVGSATLGKWWGVLDADGRPMVVLTADSWLVEEHCGLSGGGKGLQIRYSADAAGIVGLWAREPMMLMAGWMGLFSLLILGSVFGRMGLGPAPSPSPMAEAEASIVAVPK